MNYEDYKKKVLEMVTAAVPEDASVRLQTLPKNNGLLLDAIIINEKDVAITPTIYINHYYDDAEDQEHIDFKFILDEILHLYHQNKNGLHLDLDIFHDFEKMSEHIVYRLINYDKNRELLKDIPHIPYLDLAIVFVCLFPETEAGHGSILIHNCHLDHWQVSTSDLMRNAQKNTPKLLPYDLRNMGDWLNEMLPEECREEEISEMPLYVLTNAIKLHGACCILYKELLRQVAEKFSSDIVILPSSIHEVLLLPAYYDNTTEELNALVQQVNTDEVKDEDILSDHVYYYDRRANTVSF